MRPTAAPDGAAARTAQPAGQAPAPAPGTTWPAGGPGTAHGRGLTLASTWLAAAGNAISDTLLQWPADVFAMASVILTQAQAFRLALSPPPGQQWPPVRARSWSSAVEEAAHRWRVWAEDRSGPLPDLVTREWAVLRECAGQPLEQLAQGRDWRLAEALLTLHANRGRGVRGAVGCVRVRRRGSSPLPCPQP